MVEALEHVVEILTPEQMGKADQLTIESGTPGIELMQVAGKAVADAAIDLLEERTGSGASGMVCILCGPGNNGGDGFVAAQLLEEEGWSVLLGCLVDVEELSGDARLAADEWGDEVFSISPRLWEDADLVIDALFGAGLTRPITGELAEIVDALNKSGLPILSVDLPSGVDGRSGQIGGAAVRADGTVTFFRKKPGHLLYPGKASCGHVDCVDIGIKDEVLDESGSCALENAPSLWLDNWPEALKPLASIALGRLADHKFHRGHCLVLCGDQFHSGAARLAARSALRAGAGLVTLAPPTNAAALVASCVTAVMVEPVDDADALDAALARRSHDVIVAGPALGTDSGRRQLLYRTLEKDLSILIDADAISCLSDGIEAGEISLAILKDSPAALSGCLVMTPHEGEFARLFPDLSHRVREDKGLSKLDCALLAAKRSGAVVVLKGADSVIASPDGQAVIHSQGIPYLATAGSGDVLIGVVAGLMAQGMPTLDAACAGVWLHGRAGRSFGPGLIAEDLPELLPQIYEQLGELIPSDFNASEWLGMDD
ncbi:yjeF C-terminal region, hydroxyethylthiazole kinase-related/yjeF N-terminal region [Cohaesibacter sp. ES.047]|uniref:NAD(P)H-hydrate dehydratase n=1 Tax=Cohaesibacter sp. ES.047 TaxID=1798205 RepID=UPI000BB8D7C7|nr:NAD(P)H-hydrate dehydratase [Cohaesibacter sp. ES.047]SNY93754.1 yjeF C-terminal region, hydroxyethylthiazole kinase-related/yjeF N-terminal region [Cohaesibacter sp. ES.047]